MESSSSRQTKIYRCSVCSFKSLDNCETQKHCDHHNLSVCSIDSSSNNIDCEALMCTQDESNQQFYNCLMCDYKDCCKSHVLSHIKSQHIGAKPFKCGYCSFKTAHKQSLTTHIKRHKGIKPFKCEYCFWSGTESGQLKIHERKHTGEKPFKCKECDYKASSKSSLLAHRKVHDENVNKFKCLQCGFQTHTRPKLQNHLKLHGIKYCSNCSYFTRDSREFRKHNKSHKLKCKYCFKLCQDTTKLKEHESIHSGNRKWKCELCSYNSNRKSLLDKHNKLHLLSYEADSDSLKCCQCSFSTKRPSSLSIHMKTHRLANEVTVAKD